MVDSVSNSLNLHQNNRLVDRKEITNEIVGVKGLKFRLHSGDFQKVSPTKMLKDMGQDYI